MRRDAQARGIAAVWLLSALLDGAGREPLATVKTGGVGVRELTRTAGTLSASVSTVRLLLAVAEETGLAELDERVVPTAAYDRWLNLGLDRRLAVMLEAWRDLDYLPSSQTGPWVPNYDKAWSAHARMAALRSLGDRATTDLEQAAQWIWWHQPGGAARRGRRRGIPRHGHDLALHPATVRSAYDAGWTERLLTRALTKIAEGGLPQPLAYLLADVARQHGSVRVAPVASTLVGDDTALLAQICADKRLESSTCGCSPPPCWPARPPPHCPYEFHPELSACRSSLVDQLAISVH